MDFLASSLVIISMAWIFIAIITSNSRARKSSNLPPGPYQFPIIRNLFSLGSDPHRSLTKLSRKYGPVMLLKFGSITTVVVSSPETAKIVLRKHDSAFLSRTIPGGFKSLRHNESSIVWLSAGNQWRKLRKMCKEEMFSVARLGEREGLRREKMQKLHDYLGECCRTGQAVDLGSAAFTTSLNVITSSVLSLEFAKFDSESSQEIKEAVCGAMECLGSPNFSDYFPVLKFVDPQGLLKRTRFYLEKMFVRFDEIIEEKMKSRGGKNDFVDALIDLSQRGEDEFSKNDIKHLLLDLIVAGTDTTAGTVEWAMVELIRNPTKMSKLRDEVTDFIKENGELLDVDIPRLPYLQAVVNETFRLHPTAPLLVPFKADSDVEINGYIVPQNAQMLINVWAIGRHPDIWANPNEFMPERFLNENNDIDFKGQDFELIPFGAGRRICPGLPLANRIVHQMVATFVGDFEWEVEKPEEIDMKEKFGLTLQKAVPLRVVPTKA